MRRMTKTAAAGAAAVLALGLVACGDDDDDETSSGTEASAPGEQAAGGDTEAFCDALVEFNGAALSLEIDDTSSEDDIKEAGEELAPMIATIAENAPEELAGTAEDLNAVVADLTEGDAEAFNADATFETYTQFVGDAVGECDFETVDVTGVDYAFEGVPDTVPSGTVAFSFSNESEAEEHEMLIVRKADGVEQSFDEILEMSEEESESLVEFKGAAFAPPGGSSTTMAELDPGEYVMVCFVPLGGDESAPPHVTQGMVQEFSVE